MPVTPYVRHNAAAAQILGGPDRTRLLAGGALAACLDLDNHAARAHLDGLTAAQLQAVEHAAVALSLHASSLRAALPDQPDGTARPDLEMTARVNGGLYRSAEADVTEQAAAIERVRAVARNPHNAQGQIRDFVYAADVLAALDQPKVT